MSRPVQVQTNAFVIQTIPTTKTRLFFHYDTFEPEIRQPFRAQICLDYLQTVQEPALFRPRVVFDGKRNVWSSRKLFDETGATFEVRMSGKPEQRPIVVKFTLVGDPIDILSIINSITAKGKVHSRQAEAISVMQAIVRQAPIMQQKTFNARSVFTNEGARVTGGAFDLWRGFYQSVRPAIGRMLINVDISTGIVYASMRLDAWAVAFLKPGQQQVNVRSLGNLNEREEGFKALKNALKNVRIRTDVPKKSMGARPIKTIIPRAGRFEFAIEGRMTTVADYYQATYGRALQYPDSFGVVTKVHPFKVVIPAEICYIEPGQLFKKKVPPSLMDEILRFSSQPPSGRLTSIQQGINGAFLGYAQSDFLSAASVRVDTTPLSVTGTMLPTPSIKYKDRNVEPRGGAWNLVGRKFAQPGELKKWVVVSFDSAVPQVVVVNFVKDFVDTCADLGMSVEMPSNMQPIILAGQNLEKMWAEIAPYQPRFVLAVLPTNGADFRRAFKQWGETKVGIPTQCVRESKIKETRRSARDQYNRNLAMKVNTKLQGTNSEVQYSVKQSPFMSAPLMIVGADVGHAGAGVNNQPSIASVVASYDKHFSKYMTSIALQEPRTEIIADLKKMVFDACKFFYMTNKIYKFRMVFFRDGVSEGEYSKVVQQEVSAIQEAWTHFMSAFGDKIPLCLTYIVVGKRHHIRFFPPKGTPEAAMDRSGNFTAGLVVDKEITDPAISINFYLQSHGGLKGTSRSGHYVVLHDDNNLPKDMLEHMAYFLCHVYSRASRSVSIPAPVYYADLVCARAVFYFSEAVRYGSETSSIDPHDTFDLAKWQANFRPLRSHIQGQMFFV